MFHKPLGQKGQIALVVYRASDSFSNFISSLPNSSNSEQKNLSKIATSSVKPNEFPIYFI